jgi:hypothetical protein
MMAKKKDERGCMGINVNTRLLGRRVMQELDSVHYAAQTMQELDSTL